MIEPEGLLPLIVKAKQGDREGLDALVRASEVWLRESLGPTLERLRQRGIDTDDVLHETIAQASCSIARFEWQGEGSFGRWLSGIARNLLLKALRRDRRGPRLEVLREVPPAPGPSPSRALRRVERRDRFESALANLPPDQREVIVLARIDGLASAEIAGRMGRSPAAVRQLLVRALRALRKAFGDTESLSLPPAGLEERGGP